MKMKTENANSVYLKGGSYHITENPADAYRVLDGKVYVYIVPLKNGCPGRRTLVYEAGAGELIPSFYFKDIDYCYWAFCLTAAETAEIQVMEGVVTEPLKRKFAARAGVTNYEQEGFENGLVDRYRLNLVREDGFLMRTSKEKKSVAQRTDELIASAFRANSSDIPERSGNELYDALSILCASLKIPIAPFDTVTACCGKDFSACDVAGISGFPCREVVLEKGWQKTDSGALLAFSAEGSKPIACIPKGRGGYYCQTVGEKRKKLTKPIADSLNPSAYMIYKPFPQERVTPRKFFGFCLDGIRAADVITVIVTAIVSSLIGLLLPKLSQVLFDEYIPLGERSAIMQLGCLTAVFMAGNILFSIVKNIGGLRISRHVKGRVQSAFYHRLFFLPEKFFRSFESADLASRAMTAGELAAGYANLAVTAGMTVIGLAVFFAMMFVYSSELAVTAVLMFAVYIAIGVFLANIRLKHKKQLISVRGKTGSMLYQLLGGITKIRASGVEDRAVFEYMKPFVKERKIAARADKAEYIAAAVTAAIESLFMLVLYGFAYNSAKISAGEFAAFCCVFGMASSGVVGLVSGFASWRMMKRDYEHIRPVLETEPECNVRKQLPCEIDGAIDIEHVSFSYDGDRQIFEDLSLHIKAGEYVGIVGGSGCGKSTLLKLLLGFEHPNSGKIYFSGSDAEALDQMELRKKFGVVLQDGKLIAGSIYDNIVITAPNASKQDVERVAEAVGLKSDIEKMPMGLNTVLSEDCSAISGGQQQRILIARAIISNPKILLFDEATSALDNITQAKVCESLDKLSCTRIVVAHRLSTIRNCDRIIVLNNGKAEEQGTFEQLMEMNGLFRQLAHRQML